ncbi:MAG: thiamine-phosphate kinase [Halobacteriaceae archaeon]
MDERAALALIADHVPGAGDDAATVDGTVITTDMLHERTDFPTGTTRYTAGWRAVGASLSDIAAMGGDAVAAVAVYAAPTFDGSELQAFLDGASDVCAAVEASYVGGDLDSHDEFTVATTAIGSAADPVGRGGATPGDRLCVTGALGRTAAAMHWFERDPALANELFQFTPRVRAGQRLAPHATAMIDSSDGLARSLHQLAARSDCGFTVDGSTVPVDERLRAVSDEPLREATQYGEDFELIATLPESVVGTVREAIDDLAVIGTVTETDITMDGDPVPDAGYTHGR